MTATTQATNTVAKNVDAHCPAGKKVLGGGVEPLSGSGDAIVTEYSYPPEDVSWFVQAEDISHPGTTWALTAYAICANVG